MCSPNSSPYWKSNIFWPERSTGIASLRPCARASSGTVEPNCSSTSTPVTDGSAPAATAWRRPSKIEVLGVGDHRRLLWIGFALDAEELLLERAPVVEREDVELVVVAE